MLLIAQREVSKMELIIDGYNALFSLAKLRTFKLASADNRFYIERENLIRVLSEKKRFKDCQIIVIFDGKGQEARINWKGELLIIYTAERETADDLIFRFVSEKKIVVARDSHFFRIVLDKEVVVVTDDKKLGRRLKELESSIKTEEVSWLDLN